MKGMAQKLAVVTGGGTGMGRELAKQLAAQGCNVAFCDVFADTMAQTLRQCEDAAPKGTRITSHLCDVADEAQVLAFRDAVREAHGTERAHLLFNNAGISGGGSFVKDERSEWERVFGVCWFGVYYCARAFLPMLIASDEACIVNTSSVNGFWACFGTEVPHTAYSTAKFAIKGFSEALVVDLRVHAPHVKVALVMPGHIGTEIGFNSRRAHGQPEALKMSGQEVQYWRATSARMGTPVDQLSDDQVRAFVEQRQADFRDKAPLTAAGAAKIILDGVRDGRFRILVGEDAKWLDERIRAEPERIYDPDFWKF
jgi:NAD(P)-dependent dehydrogenase (short-subunit alcohol dehydrogenase family)